MADTEPTQHAEYVAPPGYPEGADMCASCGGCGAADPKDRCLGCLHDFGDHPEWLERYTWKAP